MFSIYFLQKNNFLKSAREICENNLYLIFLAIHVFFSIELGLSLRDIMAVRIYLIPILLTNPTYVALHTHSSVFVSKLIILIVVNIIMTNLISCWRVPNRTWNCVELNMVSMPRILSILNAYQHQSLYKYLQARNIGVHPLQSFLSISAFISSNL